MRKQVKQCITCKLPKRISHEYKTCFHCRRLANDAQVRIGKQVGEAVARSLGA